MYVVTGLVQPKIDKIANFLFFTFAQFQTHIWKRVMKTNISKTWKQSKDSSITKIKSREMAGE